MDPTTLQSLPFLTRNMLQFGKSAKIELEFDIFTGSSTPLLLRVLNTESSSEFKITPGGNSTRETFTQQISDFPILVSLCAAPTPLVNRGQSLAILYLKVDGVRVHELCRGYVYNEGGIAYPQGRYEPQLIGGGDLGVVQTTAVAGADFAKTIGSNIREVIKFGVATFVTDATVATRQVHFQVTDTVGNVILDIPAPISQAASLTRRYNLVPVGQAPTTVTDNEIVVPIPDNLTLEQSMKLKAATTNLQAGDDWGIVMFYSEQYRCSLT